MKFSTPPGNRTDAATAKVNRVFAFVKAAASQGVEASGVEKAETVVSAAQNTSTKSIVLRGAFWTGGTFAATQVLRFITNLILTRLLTPELFGVMMIVNALKTGMDLLSNAGLGQSVVQNEHAEIPEFYNTAWSLGLIRGIGLWIICSAAAVPFAHFFDLPILVWILPVASLSFVLASLNSLSDYQISRKLQFFKLNLFQFIIEAVSSVAHVVLAAISPTIWALVAGNLVATGARTVGTYLLLPTLRHKFGISPIYARQVWAFGKWMLLSSVVYFFATNFDRLFFGKAISLRLLGVYGVARTLADVSVLFTQRIGGIVIFPLVASAQNKDRATLRRELASIRWKFLLLAALGLSVVATMADVLVRFFYDSRYQQAGWMLSILIVGTWFSVIAALNEAALLGLGKPSFGAAGNSTKLAWIAIALPLSFANFGVPGAVAVVAVADAARYPAIFFGQRRERLSFGMQDLLLTLTLFTLIVAWQIVRAQLGFGQTFSLIP